LKLKLGLVLRDRVLETERASDPAISFGGLIVDGLRGVA
jgi:hypothetical protein